MLHHKFIDFEGFFLSLPHPPAIFSFDEDAFVYGTCWLSRENPGPQADYALREHSGATRAELAAFDLPGAVESIVQQCKIPGTLQTADVDPDMEYFCWQLGFGKDATTGRLIYALRSKSSPLKKYSTA